jgi:hypothetical protein
LRGNFDAGSFGTIRAKSAEIDVDITVKNEAWRLGTQPGIGKLELVDSTWKNGSIHLPAEVAAGAIIVDGQMLDWNDPDGLPMQNGYRLEVIQSGLQQNTFVIPASWTNPEGNLDVNNDGFLSPIDALLVINHLNRFGTTRPPRPSLLGDMPAPFRDSNGDSFISPLDALLVINRLNRQGDGEGEGAVFHERTLTPAFDELHRGTWTGPRLTPSPLADPFERPHPTIAAKTAVEAVEYGSVTWTTGSADDSAAYERNVQRVFEDDDLVDDEFWGELIEDLLADARNGAH